MARERHLFSSEVVTEQCSNNLFSPALSRLCLRQLSLSGRLLWLDIIYTQTRLGAGGEEALFYNMYTTVEVGDCFESKSCLSISQVADIIGKVITTKDCSLYLSAYKGFHTII